MPNNLELLYHINIEPELAIVMHCSTTTYLSVPILESLAHSSSSSSSASSRSSFSLFDTDPQRSDTQTDVSPPQSPDVSVWLPLKSLPDRVSRLALDTTPKQRMFRQGNEWLNTTDDIGYESEHENCISTAWRDRLKVLTRKRGVPSVYQGVDMTSSTSEDDVCDFPARDTESGIFSPAIHCCSFGSRTIGHSSAFPSPTLRKEVIGLGLDLGLHALFGGAISVDHSLGSTSTTRSACPPKPRLLPVLDAASPSPIVFLPSPVVVLGLDASDRMLTTSAISPTPLPNELTPQLPPSPAGLAVENIQELNSVNPVKEVNSSISEFSREVPTGNCTINQQNTPESASGNTSANGSQKIGQTSGLVINSGVGGPLSQAVAFASIPFYSAQPRPKKSATGLGLGRPAGLGQRPQVESASQLENLSRSNCVAGKDTIRGNSNFASPPSPCSPSRQRITAGAKRLFKPLLNRRLYAIPEVVSPPCISPTGMSAGRIPCAIKFCSEKREERTRTFIKRKGWTNMTSRPFSSDASVRAHLPPSGSRPAIRLSRSGSLESPKSRLKHESSRRFPVLIRPDVSQKFNFVKRGQSGVNPWSGLRSLF